MTRSIFAVIAAVAAVAVVSGPGCKQTGIGDPCVPEQEYDHAFLDFDEKEVNVESKSFQCQTRLCLVNHFRGRVSCPYGQSQDGSAIADGFNTCHVPGSDQKIDGQGPNGQTTRGASVRAQCTDRNADKTVYCSCRCANVNGKTDDGAIYCSCPDGFACEQLVSSIGTSNEGLTGAYCIKTGSKFDPNNECAANCDPVLKNCGNPADVQR